MDSTCSESGLSGRAKGMGDRDDLTKGRRGAGDDEDGRVEPAAEGEKSWNGMNRERERESFSPTLGEGRETLRIERDASDRGTVTRRRGEAG